MKRTVAVFALLMMLVMASLAQNRANIQGKVIDSLSHEKLEFATVAVLDLKDSSLVSYTLTTRGGDFALHNLPSDIKLKLVVSFVSFNNYRRAFTLDKGALMDMGTIKLSPKSTSLGMVNVNAEVTPIIVKKDTIEFSAEAFKTPPNAVVEELLKRLPGIEVDLNGTITINGKTVTKLLIDGKQFFVNDPKIASRNLDAALIDKVQVYDDRDNDPDHLIPDSKVNKIINLKFKNAIKKSTFGKLRAGYGTEDRFDGGVLYNTFRDTLQVSLIGIGNNLNRTGFSTQDLSSLGGFNRSGGEANNSGLTTGGRPNGGIQTVASGGVNINTDYGKKLKINLLYFYSYTSDVYNSTSFRQQFFSDTTLSTNSTGNSTSNTSKHSVSGLVEWNPDTAVKIRYAPKLIFTNTMANSDYGNFSFNNLTPKLNSSLSTDNDNNNSVYFQQTFSYYRKLRKKGESLNITHDLTINPGSGLGYSNNNFTSFTALLPSSDLHRLADNGNKNTNASLNISYRYPFTTKWTGGLSLNNNYYHTNGQLFTYNQNPATGEYTGYIDSLSHDLVRSQFTETLRPELMYQFNKTTELAVDLSIQLMQTNNQFNKNIPDIDRRDIFLLPSLRFSAGKYSINYDEGISQPSINNLIPLTTFYSQLYSAVGNPNLKPTRSHSLNFYYYDYNNEKQRGFNLYATLNYDENNVFTEKTISSQGATIAREVNKDGSYYARFGIGRSKRYKKIKNWQIRLNSSIYSNFNHNFFQVNNQEGYQNTASIYVNQSIYVNYNNKFEITPAYQLAPNITTYQSVPYSAIKYVTQRLDVPTVIRWPKRFTIETEYTYTYNPLVAPGFQRSINLLNIALARQIQKKDRGEIRISCYDLFNQNVSTYRYPSGNSITDVESQIIKRYFLFSYSYRFNSTVTKK